MKILSNYSSIKEKIKEVCERVGRDPEEITLVAVSKTFPFTRIIELNSIGHMDFGENKIREMRDKYYNISFQYSGKINWHMVGHLQSNKVKDIIAFIHLIHSVDTYNLAEVIDTTAKKINKKVDILIQVNTSNEPQKYGVAPDETERLCRQISLLENVNIKGLMTMAKFTDDRDEIRGNFRTLKGLFDKIKPDYPDFKYLSMGMTGDYDIAIEEGSNMLRIGTAIFGERVAKD
ncbi:MAG: YggS family pyridoxal phosphate-dependent enzyme [Bacteroidetes bacterium]|nr:YggS family pyridoxal phosphate-dependent enzyme [Bacteroidota bacterium]